MPKAPRSHMCEQRYKLYGRFREAVDSLLLMIRIGTSCQQARRDQVLQPACEDVRGDAFLVLLQQVAIAAPVLEHDIADNDQAPAVADLLKRQVDRAARSSRLRHGHALRIATGIVQAVRVPFNHLHVASSVGVLADPTEESNMRAAFVTRYGGNSVHAPPQHNG